MPSKLRAAVLVFVSLPWAGDGTDFTGSTNRSLKKPASLLKQGSRKTLCFVPRT